MGTLKMGVHPIFGLLTSSQFHLKFFHLQGTQEVFSIRYSNKLTYPCEMVIGHANQEILGLYSKLIRFLALLLTVSHIQP